MSNWAVTPHSRGARGRGRGRGRGRSGEEVDDRINIRSFGMIDLSNAQDTPK